MDTKQEHTIEISHRPGDWDGTFIATAAAMIRDALRDGQPIDVVLQQDGESARTHPVTAVTGPGRLHLVDGSTAALDEDTVRVAFD